MQTIDHKKLSLTCAPKSSTMGKKMGPPTFKIKGRLGQGHSKFANAGVHVKYNSIRPTVCEIS